jgi:hypothetical protein
MNKGLMVAGLLFYWLVAPLGVYLFLSGPGMGYQEGVAGLIAGIVALVPLAALPTVLKKTMTEQEAMNCTDPRKTLEYLLGKGSKRQLRLFACGVWRRTVEKWPAEPSSQRQLLLLDVAERYCDGLATGRELALSRKSAESKGRAIQFCLSRFCSYRILNFSEELSMFSFENPEFSIRSQIEIIRGILGNSQHAIIRNSTWLTPKVKTLAQTIYDKRAFDRLPILADALEEAGCDNAEMIAHCRGPGPHVRGCWVVDLISGRK